MLWKCILDCLNLELCKSKHKVYRKKRNLHHFVDFAPEKKI